MRINVYMLSEISGISSIMVSRFVREAVVLDPSKEEAKQGESTALLNNAYNVKFLVGRVKHVSDF